MKFRIYRAIAASLSLVPSPTSAFQHPPPPQYQKTLVSALDPSIIIEYKSPDAGTCQTSFNSQKQYTGYVRIPPGTLAPIQQNYSINTFFWFVEARQSPATAPLTIWLNGGPGSSSMVGLFTEMGPCKVVQVSDGSYGTQDNMWGWDRSSNLLFIDQPNQVGFSFDTATNGTYDFFTQQVTSSEQPSDGSPYFMSVNGTFGTTAMTGATSWSRSANTTAVAARAVWYFLQTWLVTFPQYNPAVRPDLPGIASTVPVGINLFSESYGGKFGPVFANFFEQQNRRRLTGQLLANETLEIRLETVGIINGLIDDAVQFPFYPKFAYNNTYGIQAISNTDYINVMQSMTSGSGACLAQIDQCRSAMATTDPKGFGDIPNTNALCEKAQRVCSAINVPYLNNGFSPYDIRRKMPSPDPPAAYQEYLNNASVLQSIGARVNYTENSRYVQSGFLSTGDTVRGGQVEALAGLLSQGIRVALIYGDADYICNWFGGEAASLAIASKVVNDSLLAGKSSYSTAFATAGYAQIVINDTYVGGVVRQHGNLSFSRVYDAGHLVPYYQPETAFTIFSRIIQGNDIATGKQINSTVYVSNGTSTANYTNTVASSTPSPTCWIRSWNSTCSSKDTEAMLAGKGVAINGMFFRDSRLVSMPHSSIIAASPGRPLSRDNQTDVSAQTSSKALTGVYTATGTPKPSQAFLITPPSREFILVTTASVCSLVSGMMIMLRAL